MSVPLSACPLLHTRFKQDSRQKSRFSFFARKIRIVHLCTTCHAISMVDLQPTFDAVRAWKMVEAHDASADGLFVYAVRSTGIFCRPSCPSRRPAQRHVVFYRTPREASAAGYRACKRCRPQTLHPQAAAIDAACRYLEQQRESLPTLAQTARAAGMSPFALQRLFRRVLGISPREYHAEQRSQRFRKKLGDHGQGSVTEAMYAAGYSSASRVYERSAQGMGMAPAQYRRGGAGEMIRCSIGQSDAGLVLVAATERGICAVLLGHSEAELEAQLQREFPKAMICSDDASMSDELQGVLSQITEHPLSKTLPLDVRATAFQRRVWQALQQIPRGKTATYAQVAAAIGQPTAVRAVARACGQNRIAVLIPCHRVIGSNGKLTGYRWGLKRKQKLLEQEASSAAISPLNKNAKQK